MFRIVRRAALASLAAAIAAPLAAQSTSTPAPPAWEDGASVYLTMAQQQPPPDTHNANQRTAAVDESADSTRGPLAPTTQFETTVIPAAHPPVVPAPQFDERRLAPPSDSAASTARVRPDGFRGRPIGVTQRIGSFGVPLESVYTTISALAIVIGLLFLCVWLLRRGARKTATALPADVVSVLGRTPLAARQSAELVRVGNKLVLISLTPTGAKTLTEVTDPAEVDRLVGLCRQHDPHSTTKAFEQVFHQLSREPVPGGFLGHEAPLTTLSAAADVYRAQRGGANRD